jgi:hypothetical protein
VAERRQVHRRLEGASRSRKRPRPDLDRRRRQANGGNCYNCHQISKEEISFGTIGPSLYNYGKLRGVTTRTAPPPSRRRIHLGQDLERQGLQRLLQHAARRPHAAS